MAIHGSGMARTAIRRNHFVSCIRTEHRTKAVAKKAIRNIPIPAMMRKLQNRAGTFGTVSQAAFWICSGEAWRGSATWRFSKRA